MRLDKSWKVEDLFALWSNVVVGHDVVTTSSRSDVIIDTERSDQARLFDAFGQEDLLDVFSDEEESTGNGQAYEEYLSLELRKRNKHRL